MALLSASSRALIAANLVPVIGMLWPGWALADLILLYWAESAIVGFYAVFKIVVVGRRKAVFAIPIFFTYFGSFMAVHLWFVYMGFVRGESLETLGESLTTVVAIFRDLKIALAALLASHGVSFYTNFIRRREYRGRSLIQRVVEPYKRVVVMQLAVFLWGFLTMQLGSPIIALVILIVLKIVVDIRAHSNERTNAATRSK